jgi:hypothetical protein
MQARIFLSGPATVASIAGCIPKSAAGSFDPDLILSASTVS